MASTLKIILATCIVCFFIYIIHNVKHDRLSVRHALPWAILSIITIICIFQVDNLRALAQWTGVETFSNLIFFFGFVFLIFVIFNQSRTISAQNKKLTTLAQEIALIKKKLENAKKHK